MGTIEVTFNADSVKMFKTWFRLLFWVGTVLLLLLLAGCNAVDLSETDCTDTTFLVNTFDDIDDGKCNDGHCSLREAIIAANTCTEHTSYAIELPDAGTYTLTIRGGGDERGDLDITRDMTITGVGKTDTIIEGESTWVYRIFEVHPGVTADFQSLMISNGNTAGSGGGIYNHGTINLNDVLLIANRADERGGGLFNAGDATIVGSTIQQNLANDAYDFGCGGAIHNTGMLRIDFTTIERNDAYSGPGICNRNGDVFMSDVTIRDNGATTLGVSPRIQGIGGGLSSWGGDVHLENTHLVGNSARLGGGMYITQGSLEFLFSTVTDNEALIGGGLYLGATSSVVMDHVAVNGNHVQRQLGRDGEYWGGQGGGIYINTPNWDITDSPVTDNSAESAGGGLYISAVTTTQGYFVNAPIANNETPNGPGAGAYVERGNVLFRNTTFSNNDGVGKGVVYFNSGNANTRFVHTTFGANSGSENSELEGNASVPWAINNEPGGTIAFLNSLIAGIGDGATCWGDRTGLSSEGGNVFIGEFCVEFPRTDDNYLFLSYRLNDLFMPLMDIDGTLVHPLIPSSPAVDFIEERLCISDDQRGVARPQGDRCDSGAFELDASTLSGEVPAGDDDQKSEEDKGSEPSDDKSDDKTQACEYTAAVNLFCRTGPGSVYTEIDSFVPDTVAAVLGISPDGFFVQVTGPNFGEACYVPLAEQFGSLSGACDDLEELPVPPTPTFTPTPTQEPVQDQQAKPTETPKSVKPTDTPKPNNPTKAPKPSATPTCDKAQNCTNQP